jgi:hypothetical protein
MKIKRPRLVGLALLMLLASILILQRYLTFPLDVERQLKTLSPVFQAKVRVWLKLVKERLGLDVVITSARRTYAQQAAQHAANPNNPAPDLNNPDVHMRGIAVDVNFKNAKGEIVVRKASTPAQWAPIVALAKACKIHRWGGDFKTYSSDRVHFDDL